VSTVRIFTSQPAAKSPCRNGKDQLEAGIDAKVKIEAWDRDGLDGLYFYLKKKIINALKTTKALVLNY